MNIYDYLKKDHEQVAKYFKQFENSHLAERKKEIVLMIIRELLTHANAEQETFYKVLEQYSESKEEAFHGEKEHAEIIAQITAISNTKVFGESWEKKVLKLKELVEHHVREEEGQMFHKAKKVIPTDEAFALKEVMHNYKEKLLFELG